MTTAKEPLLVVDVQRGFLNDYTQHIPGRLAHLIESGAYGPLLFTQFVNTRTSPYQRLLKWKDCAGPPDTDLAPEVAPFARDGLVFQKRGKTGLPPALARYLRAHRIKQVAVAGIDTDMCVLKVAMDLFDMQVEPVILADCCASTAGLQAHLAGLAILSRNVGPYQLRLTPLHEGYLTAPRGDPTPSATARWPSRTKRATR